MDFDTPRNRQSLIDVFPDLDGDGNFRILSDCTYTYNCIAWAMGYDDRWVDICSLPGHWWPRGVVRDTSPEALVSAFMAEGFEVSDNQMPEEGYSKVVLYKKEDREEWTHAARIVSPEVEYSKFGSAWDGQHSHDVLCKTAEGQKSQSYGVAYAYMKRKTAAVSPTSTEGKIIVDTANLSKLKALLKR